MNGKAQKSAKDLQQKAAHFITETEERVADETKATINKVDRQAHKQPWLFVGIAASLASVVGFILGRKSKA